MKRLAWSLLGLYVALSGAGVALLKQVPAAELERVDNSFVLSLTFVLVVLVFALVGAVVASRLPANPIGWLFLALALLEGVYELAFGYAHYALHADPGALPGAAYAAWVSNWASPLSPPVLGLTLLLFPDGRVPSPRWRVLAWCCFAAVIPVLAHHGFAPGPLGEFPALVNPLGIEGATFLSSSAVDGVVTAVFVATIVSLIVRFHRARGVERQQLKWLAYAVGLMAAYFVVGGVAGALLPLDGAGESHAAGYVFAALVCGVPLSAGVAMLRYRLYDIDLVIRRTLVYGALTATLAAGYLGGVLLSQLIIGADSSFAVAASTLAVAALFRPARARIQAVVDRRFYRPGYDAERTLEAFSGRLRDELDLEALGADLRGVVGETMQPAHVSLWLRGERIVKRLAWGLCVLFVAIEAAILWLVAHGNGAADEALGFLLIGYPVIGAVIVSRRPRNAVGWLLIGIGLTFALQTLCEVYVADGSFGYLAAAVVAGWVWYVWFLLAGVFLPLVFPDGRLLSRRWRPVVWIALAALAASIVGIAFKPGDLEVSVPVDNPVAASGAWVDVVAAFEVAGNLLAIAAFLLTAASLVLRVRRARGVERQQLKWFALAGMFGLTGIVLAMVAVVFGEAGWRGVVGNIGWFTFLGAVIVGIPGATGIAILRHRLYDIDLVLRRTLVYGVLSLALGAAYLGAVLLLGLALGPLTEDSKLAVAGSTLAVAALFGPARARIQAAVDRRFYRRRYDASRTLEAFGGRLRDELDLEALAADLRGVVSETVAPAHVTLWLREADR